MRTGIFLVSVEQFLNLLANLAIGDFDIILGLAIVGHQGKKAIIRDVKLDIASGQRKIFIIAVVPRACGDTYKLEFLANDIGHIHVVGRRAKFFELLSGENVNGDKVDLCVTVLAGL